MQNGIHASLRQPPHLLSAQFGNQLHVVSPAVIRYEDQQWIDQFFDTGKLRLSTFSKFASYQDEIRGDPNEGLALCHGSNGNFGEVILVQRQGINSLIFCTSQRLDKSLGEKFSRDSAFEIFNPVMFSMEISRQLPGFVDSVQGPCIYRNDSIISRNTNLNIEDYRLPDGNIDMNFINDSAQQLGGAELLLLKRKKYMEQQEYRLIWNLENKCDDYFDIIAPKARAYCRKIETEEW